MFFILGLFAWWTFQTVSLPPALRNLFEEDQAMAEAATPPSEEESFLAELNRLPAPPQEHAPEVASLLERLKNLPPIPYGLANALARDAATPQGQPPPPWSPEEISALENIRQAYLQAWQPFFGGPAPDWSRYPDSILLFRSTGFLLGQTPKVAELMSYQPGQRRRTSFLTNPEEVPELMFPLLRQCRNLGAIRFGVLQWELSETVCTADLIAGGVGRLLSDSGVSRPWLENLRASLAPAPTMLDLRASLAADRALFVRTADYLESLPPATSARAGLFRLLGDEQDTRWYLRSTGNPETAHQLGAQLRRDAEQLEILRQKTFLPGPAWRQWLSEDPGQGLNPLLAKGLGGFREFENVRMTYLVALAGLDARIAWEEGGLSAARRIRDPAQPGSFLQVEESPEGVRITSAHVSAGETTPASFVFPGPAEIGR